MQIKRTLALVVCVTGLGLGMAGQVEAAPAVGLIDSGAALPIEKTDWAAHEAHYYHHRSVVAHHRHAAEMHYYHHMSVVAHHRHAAAVHRWHYYHHY